MYSWIPIHCLLMRGQVLFPESWVYRTFSELNQAINVISGPWDILQGFFAPIYGNWSFVGPKCDGSEFGDPSERNCLLLTSTLTNKGGGLGDLHKCQAQLFCESLFFSLKFLLAGHSCIMQKSAYILDNLFLCCFRFLITAPNVVHLGTRETITVQVYGAQHPVQVTAYFKDETKNQLLSERIIFNLNQNNNYQEMKKVMVSLPS